MSITYIAGGAGSETLNTAAARMFAVGAAALGETVLTIGVKPVPQHLTGIYAIKEGGRIAPLKIGVIVIDNVSDEYRAKVIQLFNNSSAALVGLIGAITMPNTILAVTKTVQPPTPKRTARARSKRDVTS